MNNPITFNYSQIRSLNIKIIDSCILNCPYCFVQCKQTENEKVMSIDDYDYIIDFCINNHIQAVRLTGGEPTLHPNFKVFVQKAMQLGMHVHVFSNFAVKDSIRLLNVLPKMLTFFANINDYDFYTPTQWQIINENLELAFLKKYRTTLGYIADRPVFDISHIIDIAERLQIKKIMISPSKPTITDKNLWLSESDTMQFAIELVNLHKILQPKGIRLFIDCPIPFCHIPDEYVLMFVRELDLTGSCTFSIFIDTNLDVGHCYITDPLLQRKSLKEFNDIETLIEYTRLNVKHIQTQCPKMPACESGFCVFVGLCAGGCYGIRYLQNIKGVN